MLNKIAIQNFKAHQDTALDLGKLTVLTGLNSAGKSSIIQSLLLLRQSRLKGVLEKGLDLSGPLSAPSVGAEILCRYAATNVLSLSIEDEHGLFKFDFDVEKDMGSSFVRRQDVPDVAREPALAGFALFGKNFQYVSAARIAGESHFGRCDYEVNELGQISKERGRGEAVAHYLHAHGGDPVTNYLYNGQNYDLSSETVAWERLISAGLTIDVQKSETNGFDIWYGYKVKDKKPITGLRAENIGYGVSNVLPVIVALLSATEGGLVLLENPEGDLHPGGQAEIAKLIARVADAGVQVIVETHSDHILNGIMLAVRQHEFDKQPGIARKDVRIYYFDRDGVGIRTSEVVLAEHGGVVHQPNGFFDQAEKDYLALKGL